MELWVGAEGRAQDRAPWTRALAPGEGAPEAGPWSVARRQLRAEPRAPAPSPPPRRKARRTPSAGSGLEGEHAVVVSAPGQPDAEQMRILAAPDPETKRRGRGLEEAWRRTVPSG